MMEDLRLAAVAARVVAWHNRHPLARRISAAHVHAVGYVGLPFVGAPGVAAPAAAVPPVDPAAGDAEMVDLTALEVGAPETGRLRERALARARQRAAAPDAVPPGVAPQAAAPPGAADAPLPPLASLQPDFSEDFIDPLPPRAVARFAGRAGQVLARPPEDGPLRQVAAGGAHPGRLPARVYLLTAVIETGTRKSRVLLGGGLGGGLGAPVLGRRIFDGTRLAVLGALAALVVGVPAWLLQPVDDALPAPQAALPAAPVPAPAASAASAASIIGIADETAAAAVPAPAATAAVPAPAAVEAASAAETVPASNARASEAIKMLGPAIVAASAVAPQVSGGPVIRPVISDEDKALARQARQSREAAAASQPAAARSPETPKREPAMSPPHPPKPAEKPAEKPSDKPADKPAPAPATPALPLQAAPAAGPAQPAPGAAVFALSTRALRTRAEAEQVQVAMRSLLRSVGAGELRVDVLPQGDDWRVVALPFTQRAAAEKARMLLVSRGMRVEVVDF